MPCGLQDARPVSRSVCWCHKGRMMPSRAGRRPSTPKNGSGRIAFVAITLSAAGPDYNPKCKPASCDRTVRTVRGSNCPQAARRGVSNQSREERGVPGRDTDALRSSDVEPVTPRCSNSGMPNERRNRQELTDLLKRPRRSLKAHHPKRLRMPSDAEQARRLGPQW